MNVFPVGMRTNQNLAALEVFGKPACRFVRCSQVDVRAFREALHHVVEHYAAILAV